MRLPLFAILAVCIAAASPTFALERTTLRASVDGEEIPVYLYLPDGKGPFPLLVMSHGSPRDAADRATFGADVLRKEAEAFVKKGIAVAVPLRRGYGESTHWAESYGTCKEGHYFEAGLQTARDIWAAAKVAGADSHIDPRRVALIGVSAGGFGSIAAGAQNDVLGVVNFAGGRGSRGPDQVCSENNLVDAFRRYGAGSKIPELWFYSINDHFFGPRLAHRLYDAFASAGGKAVFVEAPAYRDEGHAFFNDIADWMPRVLSFLAQIGLTP